ncbi:MAG: nitroreductase family deazaflavin-dependent oxidoreductase [Anaerolineaceae bacterium]|nr:nitroreductase family deazaflavin-dependent oxidoreductase [Anaerolineaceae bacterium]
MAVEENKISGKTWDMMKLYPKSQWTKFLLRLPILTWRLGLGPITGKIFMVITTTGRKSGQPRRVMVEYHKLRGIKYAPCAFGEQAAWYQNILVDPRVTIQTADGSEQVKAERVTDFDEILAVFNHFMQMSPAMTKWYFSSLGIEPTPQSLAVNMEKIYFLRFNPVNTNTPEGLDVDLAWLWPAGIVVFSVLNGIRRLFRKVFGK